MGGHYAEDNLRISERLFQVGGRLNGGGEPKSGQVDVVDLGIVYPCGQIGLVDPEFELRKSRSQNDGERRPPATGPDNRKILHNLNTLSVPSRSRRTLLLCL